MRKITIFCFLLALFLVFFGIYLKIGHLNDANAYLLGGGIPLVGFVLSQAFIKVRIKK